MLQRLGLASCAPAATSVKEAPHKSGHQAIALQCGRHMLQERVRINTPQILPTNDFYCASQRYFDMPAAYKKCVSLWCWGFGKVNPVFRRNSSKLDGYVPAAS